MLKKSFVKLLILFLLLSQFVTITHALEHQLIEDEPEQCSICLHESDSKNGILDTPKYKNPDLIFNEKLRNQSDLYTLNNFSLCRNRSPPTALI